MAGWQKRWFILTRSRLHYFRMPSDTREQAQLGEVAPSHTSSILEYFKFNLLNVSSPQVSLSDIIAVYEESATEFVIVVSNSQREPYTLKASNRQVSSKQGDIKIL